LKIALALVVALVAGCDDGGESAALEGGGDAANQTDAGLGGADAEAADVAAPEPDAATVVAPAEVMAYSGGACPTFAGGENAVSSAGVERSFRLYLPAEPTGAPILFLWHPLGGNAQWMARFMDAEEAAVEHEMIIAVPDSREGILTEWGYLGDATPDLTLFDDLLSCLSVQYQADLTRVYTSGFSAGALWSSYLVVNRAEHLAAAVILSGGVGMFFEYETPRYRLPVLLAWGGPRDVFNNGLVRFNELSAAFRDALVADDHFVVSCVHNGGHTPPAGVASWGYNFFNVHRVRDGQSPLVTGLGFFFPEICEISE